MNGQRRNGFIGRSLFALQVSTDSRQTTDRLVLSDAFQQGSANGF